MEGGLRQPERPPVRLGDEAYWNEEQLDEEMRRQFDVCHGCRRCFNLCDSFPRLFDLIDESETLELDSVDSAGFGDVVGACTLCDMCFMVSCPYVPPHEFAIDIPRLMLRARAIDFRAGRVSWIDRQLAETERNGKLASLVAGIMNVVMKIGLVRAILEVIAGIARKAELPAYVARPMIRRTRTRPEPDGSAPAAGREAVPYLMEAVPLADLPALAAGRKAVLYLTCFVNYNTPSVGKAALAVLARNGIDVETLHPGCCGMPQMEHGDVDRVRENARRIAAVFRPHIESGRTVIALTPSCALMLKSEWRALEPDNEDIRLLAENTQDIDEYVVGIAEDEGLAPGLAALDGGVTLHLACHSRAQNIGPKSAQMLREIPDIEVKVVERCSGHGGTWGVKKPWFEIARKVGRPVVREAAKADNLYLSSACPLAGIHLSQLMKDEGNSDAPRSRHPIELLAASYEMGDAR